MPISATRRFGRVRRGRPRNVPILKSDLRGLKALQRLYRINDKQLSVLLRRHRSTVSRLFSRGSYNKGIRALMEAVIQYRPPIKRHTPNKQRGSKQPKPKPPFPIGSDPRIKVAGLAVLPERNQNPKVHAKLDGLELRGYSHLNDQDDELKKLIRMWIKKGYRVKNRMFLWEQAKKPWGLVVHHPDGGLVLRAFEPAKETIGEGKDRRRIPAPGFWKRVELKISGKHYNQGLASELVRDLLVPLVDRRTVEVFKLDIAVDIEESFPSFLFFRERAPTWPSRKKAYPRRIRSASTARTTTDYVQWCNERLRAYDKRQWLQDGWVRLSPKWYGVYHELAAVPGLSHTRGWKHCMRVEATIQLNAFEPRPKSQRPRLSRERYPILAMKKNPFGRLLMVDLRDIPKTDPWWPSIAMAKLTSPERVCEHSLGQDPELCRAFYRRLREASRGLQPKHPADIFIENREQLEADQQAVMALCRPWYAVFRKP